MYKRFRKICQKPPDVFLKYIDKGALPQLFCHMLKWSKSFTAITFCVLRYCHNSQNVCKIEFHHYSCTVRGRPRYVSLMSLSRKQ